MTDDSMDILYKPMHAIVEIKAQNALLDTYIEAYRNRYGTDPMFSLDNAHFTTLKDFSRVAKEKSHDLIKHYLRMNDEWFIRNGHSLEVLKRSLSAVNADFGKKTIGAPTPKGVLMDAQLYCIDCKEFFSRAVPLNYDFNEHAQCKKCTERTDDENRRRKTEDNLLHT